MYVRSARATCREDWQCNKLSSASKEFQSKKPKKNTSNDNGEKENNSSDNEAGTELKS